MLCIPNQELLASVKSFNPEQGNGVDELRYLFITSQVEIVDDAEKIQSLQYNLHSDK